MPMVRVVRLALQRQLAPGVWDGIATVTRLDQKFERNEVIIRLELSFIFGVERDMIEDISNRMKVGARFRIVEIGTDFIREAIMLKITYKRVGAVATLQAVEQMS